MLIKTQNVYCSRHQPNTYRDLVSFQNCFRLEQQGTVVAFEITYSFILRTRSCFQNHLRLYGEGLHMFLKLLTVIVVA